MRIAIVGAGVSGLVCRRTLLVQGPQVVVFEKSRDVVGYRRPDSREPERAAYHCAAPLVRAERERGMRSPLASGQRAPHPTHRAGSRAQDGRSLRVILA